MSFEDWVKNGWLEVHKSSKEEIANLLGIVERDLKDSKAKDVSNDWRFAIAYNAALQASTAALAAAGYRATRESHHHRVIQSLEFTLDPERKMIDTFDTFRKKRNISSYDVAGSVSDNEAKEMHELAAALRTRVERWIRKNHPMLMAHTGDVKLLV